MNSIKIKAKIQVLAKEKKELKKLALQIKTAKNCLKEIQRKVSYIGKENHRTQVIWGNLEPRVLERSISDLKYEFRYRHIVYCLLRGREYPQIENNSKNSPDFQKIFNMRMIKEREIHLRIGILRLEEEKKGLSEEVLNSLLGIEKPKFNIFFFGVDKSHCSSCWESSDCDLYWLATTRTLPQIEKLFRKYVRKNYALLIQDKRYSSLYPDFLEEIRNMDNHDCLYSHVSGQSYMDDICGKLMGSQYDVKEYLNPESLFSKEEYSSLINLAKEAKVREDDLNKKREELKKEIVEAQNKYDKEVEKYQKQIKKYEDYLELRKQFEGDNLPEIKKPDIQEPVKPDTLYPERRLKKGLSEANKFLEEIFKKRDEIENSKRIVLGKIGELK